MGRQSDMEKIHVEIDYLKLNFRHSSYSSFSSPSLFFSSVFSGFFFCRFLSFLCLGSFLFLQVPFFFFTMGFFLLRVLSILVGTVLLLPLWVTSSSFLLQFQIFFNSSDLSSYSMKLKSLRL